MSHQILPLSNFIDPRHILSHLTTSHHISKHLIQSYVFICIKSTHISSPLTTSLHISSDILSNLTTSHQLSRHLITYYQNSRYPIKHLTTVHHAFANRCKLCVLHLICMTAEWGIKKKLKRYQKNFKKNQKKIKKIKEKLNHQIMACVGET